jgi:hypothetical protein
VIDALLFEAPCDQGSAIDFAHVSPSWLTGLWSEIRP